MLNGPGSQSAPENGSFASPEEVNFGFQDYADLLVEEVLVVELKCVERLTTQHMAQCLNYLRASGRTRCLLINFQNPRLEWKRIVRGFRVPGLVEQPAKAG